MKKQYVITIYLEADENSNDAQRYFDQLTEQMPPKGVSVSDMDIEEIYVPTS